MTTADILKRVRRIEIKTKGLSNHVFAGEYHSAFKGRGMSFSEVREYAPGDDIRSIDWNVTARFRTPYVKVFEEERELTVVLLVDISSSALFGMSGRTKREIITEIAAVIGFSANTNGDKVGVLFFSDKVEAYIPPKKGRSHILRIIRELIAREPVHVGGTRIGAAFDYLNRIQKRRAITFVLSDFVSEAYDTPLQLAARRHDVVGVRVWDQLDKELPDAGLVQVRDAETGDVQWIDTGNKKVRQQYRQSFEGMRQYAVNAFRKSGAGLVDVATDGDYVKALQQFFLAR